MSQTKILPEKYLGMEEGELKDRVLSAKNRLGKKVCILGHYYQRSEILDFADVEGDSYALAKEGAKSPAEFIVFCGVHFMAESSVILTNEGQRVFMPNLKAGCPLADFASIYELERAFFELEKEGLSNDFLPVVYMNSSAAVKAFAGRRGGIVCTSSSVKRAFDWVNKQNKKVFFLPDRNLCLNTCFAAGVSRDQVLVWDQFERLGGLESRMLSQARVIAWNGYCHVHTVFTPEHVRTAREKYPDAKVVVHPECDPKVVSLSDASGSTSFIKEFADTAPGGSTVVVGTEINFVSRLAVLNPDKKIVPLARSLCPNMFRTSLADLLWTLEELPRVNEVFVDPATADGANLALKRMLEV